MTEAAFMWERKDPDVCRSTFLPLVSHRSAPMGYTPRGRVYIAKTETPPQIYPTSGLGNRFSQGTGRPFERWSFLAGGTRAIGVVCQQMMWRLPFYTFSPQDPWSSSGTTISREQSRRRMKAFLYVARSWPYVPPFRRDLRKTIGVRKVCWHRRCCLNASLVLVIYEAIFGG